MELDKQITELDENQMHVARKIVEEKLESVPAGLRMKLSKEATEALLFLTGVQCPPRPDAFGDNAGNILPGVNYQLKDAKFPVWNGPFLSKLDLSEVSFDNVVWDFELLTELVSGHGLGNKDSRYFRDVFLPRLKQKYCTVRDNQVFVTFSNTNANIDFSKAFSTRVTAPRLIDKCISIRNCDFSGTALGSSSLDKVNKIFDSNFSNTALDNESLYEPLVFRGPSIYGNCDFSNSGVNFAMYFDNLQELRSRGVKVEGCFVDGIPVEEIKADERHSDGNQNDFYNRLFDEIQGAELVPVEEGRRGKH